MTEGATSSLFQTPFWGEFKSNFGWSPLRIAAGNDDVLVLSRPVAPGIVIAYVPHPSPRVDLAALHRRLADNAAGGAGSPTFLRVDPRPGAAAVVSPASAPAPGSDSAATQSPPAPFRKAPIDVQPPATTVLDLGPSEEELLAGMKSKTRYNVRLAAKRGVTTRRAELPEIDRWYELYRETAQRDRIAIHSRDYYRALLETAEAHSDVHLSLYLAEHEGDLLGGIIVGRHGATAVYLYGASSNTKRNLMAPYLLQWEAIREAKAAGADGYDFFGIPPAEDPKHPMHGLYRFKVGFGGAILFGPGSQDAPLQPLRYSVYRSAERLRNYYFKVLKKRLGGAS